MKKILLQNRKKDKSLFSFASNRFIEASGRVRNLEYPELIKLNGEKVGRPVFWIHAGLGGAETYVNLASCSERPFYAIQPKGWMADCEPLMGIEKIAKYYIEVIKNKQSAGPYDIGGYSLGGTIGYEMARQMQSLGDTVETLVMLDTPDTDALKHVKMQERTGYLQGINFMLMASILQNPEKFKGILIHQDEIRLDVDDSAFIEQLIALGKQRGIKKSSELLKKQIVKGAEVMRAFRMLDYHAKPLINPYSLTCFYFRNKNRLLHGELSSYFSLPGDANVIENVEHWVDWKRNIPNMHIIDVDSANHLTLLSQKNVYEAIFGFCSILYSESGVSKEALGSFEEKITKIHGVLVKESKA